MDKWVEAQQQKPVILHGLEPSVYTRMARLVLEEKDVNYSLKVMNVFESSEEHDTQLTLNPFRRIPVLEHGDFILFETSAINTYLDEIFPGKPLQPSGIKDRAIMNQVIGIVDSYAYQPMMWGVFYQRMVLPREGGVANEALIAEPLEASIKCLASLADILGTKPFFAGSELSLADLHLFPILHYFYLTPEGKAAIADYKELLRWYRSMMIRYSAEQTRSSYYESVVR